MSMASVAQESVKSKEKSSSKTQGLKDTPKPKTPIPPAKPNEIKVVKPDLPSVFCPSCSTKEKPIKVQASFYDTGGDPAREQKVWKFGCHNCHTVFVCANPIETIDSEACEYHNMPEHEKDRESKCWCGASYEETSKSEIDKVYVIRFCPSGHYAKVMLMESLVA